MEGGVGLGGGVWATTDKLASAKDTAANVRLAVDNMSHPQRKAILHPNRCPCQTPGSLPGCSAFGPIRAICSESRTKTKNLKNSGFAVLIRRAQSGGPYEIRVHSACDFVGGGVVAGRRAGTGHRLDQWDRG